MLSLRGRAWARLLRSYAKSCFFFRILRRAPLGRVCVPLPLCGRTTLACGGAISGVTYLDLSVEAIAGLDDLCHSVPRAGRSKFELFPDVPCGQGRVIAHTLPRTHLQSLITAQQQQHNISVG